MSNGILQMTFSVCNFFVQDKRLHFIFPARMRDTVLSFHRIFQDVIRKHYLEEEVGKIVLWVTPCSIVIKKNVV